MNNLTLINIIISIIIIIIIVIIKIITLQVIHINFNFTSIINASNRALRNIILLITLIIRK
jgi:hypothetical protein